MHSTEKEKMCVQCEGRIPMNIGECPFCGAPQEGQKVRNSFKAPLFESKSLKDSLASLYTPPYQGKGSPPTQEELPFYAEPEREPAAPYGSIYRDVSNVPFRDVAAEELAKATTQGSDEVKKSSLWMTILLVTGSNLLLLSLMQLFFSKGGFLRLEWDASYWFLYLLASLPLLYFGVKQWKELPE
jgi:hypothetical protein